MRAKQKSKKKTAVKRSSFLNELDALLRKELALKQRKKKEAAEKKAIATYVAELDELLKKEIAAKARKRKQAAKKRAITIANKKLKREVDREEYIFESARQADDEERSFEQAAHIESEDEEFVPNEIIYPEDRRDSPFETGEFAPVEIFDNSVQSDVANLLKVENAEVNLYYAGQSVRLSSNQNFLAFTNMTDDVINRYYRLIERLIETKKGFNPSPFVIFTRRKVREIKDSYYIAIEEIELVGLSKEQVIEFDLGSYFFKYF